MFHTSEDGLHAIVIPLADRIELVIVATGTVDSQPQEGCSRGGDYIVKIILPLLGLLESPKPLPASISDDVLAKSKSKLAPAE